MIKNIKKIALICAALGALSPLISFKSTIINVSIGLLNLGLIETLVAFTIVILSLHSFYLNEYLEKKLSIVFNSVAILISIVVFVKTLLKLKEIKNSLGVLSTFISSGFSYSWGWILLAGGLIIALVCNILQLLKKEEEIISE